MPYNTGRGIRVGRRLIAPEGESTEAHRHLSNHLYGKRTFLYISLGICMQARRTAVGRLGTRFN